MGSPEPAASTEPKGERQHDTFERWLRPFTGGATFQIDLLTAFAKTTVQTGRFLLRQNAVLAETWLQAIGGTGAARTPGTAGLAGQPPTDERSRADSDVPATGRAGSWTRATETTTDSPTQQAHLQERAQERTDSARPSPTTGTEGTGPASTLEQLSVLGPRDAEQLRSAEVHTLEQLAAARPKKLAAETGLDASRVRVWVFRARRVRNW